MPWYIKGLRRLNSAFQTSTITLQSHSIRNQPKGNNRANQTLTLYCLSSIHYTPISRTIMCASRNPESVTGQGEFQSRIPPSEPLTSKGHKPFIKTGNDRVPEFHAEAHPAGTAPREHTYEPRPEGEVPAQAYDAVPSASETLGGATSQDVYQGIGKPMQGQEGRELRGDHLHQRKKEGTGFAGVGGSQGADIVREKGGDLPEGVYKGTRGKASADYAAAEDRVPTNAEELASERK
ncbi:hypothetical protein GGS20DRAFT_527987 [Poronia punctata]|nr:hypothetical protein GGS20DRAFT_527987 [Poronia punctata]